MINTLNSGTETHSNEGTTEFRNVMGIENEESFWQELNDLNFDRGSLIRLIKLKILRGDKNMRIPDDLKIDLRHPTFGNANQVLNKLTLEEKYRLLEELKSEP